MIVALAACADTRVDGEVDGQAIDVASATYVELPGLFGDDGAILAWLLPGENACGTLTRWMAVSETSRDPAELTAQWNATFPAEFWEVALVLRVRDPLASIHGTWLLGAPWNEETDAAGEAYAELAHHLKARDVSYFSGVVADPEEWTQRWYSHLGLLQVHRHAPGERLTGVFTTEAADPDDGTRAGEVVVRFAADHCADVEALLSTGGG